MINQHPSILDESLPILIRESLSDHGTQKHTNQSPDIVIVKFELTNPLKDLTSNYDKEDPSKDGDGSGNMYIYVRFKNTSCETINGFYIHLYRNHLGLYNDPKDWTKYEMKTTSKQSVYIESLKPGSIGVTEPFIYDSSQLGAHPNCFVAVATRDKDPDYSSINSFERYVKWIDKPNVAARNVCVYPRSVRNMSSRIYFKNPHTDREALLSFYIKVHEKNTSSGIQYGISHQELNINVAKTYTVGAYDSSFISYVVTIPAGYSSSLLLWYQALEDDHVDIQGTYLVYEDSEQEHALFDRYGINLRENFNNILESIPATANPPMRAIVLGGCRIKYNV